MEKPAGRSDILEHLDGNREIIPESQTALHRRTKTPLVRVETRATDDATSGSCSHSKTAGVDLLHKANTDT